MRTVHVPTISRTELLDDQWYEPVLDDVPPKGFTIALASDRQCESCEIALTRLRDVIANGRLTTSVSLAVLIVNSVAVQSMGASPDSIRSMRARCPPCVFRVVKSARRFAAGTGIESVPTIVVTAPDESVLVEIEGIPSAAALTAIDDAVRGRRTTLFVEQNRVTTVPVL
jgi:hypothetical protein